MQPTIKLHLLKSCFQNQAEIPLHHKINNIWKKQGNLKSKDARLL